MPHVNVVCFLASYSVAFGFDAWRLRARTGWSRVLSLMFGAAGLLAQTMYLLLRSSQSHQPPLLSSAHDWLLVLAWLAVLTHLFVSMLDSTIASGIVVWPVVLSLIVGSWFVVDSPSQRLNFHHNWKMLHASMLVLGTAAILSGFVLSLLYLWQHRRLKHRQMMNSGLTLPSLERLERFNRWAILVSVPLLTFGVATGIGLTVVANQYALPAWSDPVVLGGAIAWLMMCGLFCWLLLGKRPPGRQVAGLTAWACGFLLFMIVGLQVLTAAVGVRTVHGPEPKRAAQEPPHADSPKD
ncbi:MAG: cytochrome c biogenesis protein CcsA [Planctomycetes bacterium]|nr:cytochrome c biogenesis protein CcsA [Planctomycetota bacterium]